jgi:hypothetical protein
MRTDKVQQPADGNTVSGLLRDGDDRDRTGNPRLAKAVLSQLSYVPENITSCPRNLRLLTAGLPGEKGHCAPLLDPLLQLRFFRPIDAAGATITSLANRKQPAKGRDLQ